MRLCLLVLCMLVAVALCAPANSAVIYIKWDSPGPVFDGSSWETAYQTIQEGIDAATAGDEVWVAAGIYAGCVLGPDLGLYGGFSGSETSRIERSPEVHITSMHAGAPPSRNRVVVASDRTTVDGFCIRGGETGVYSNLADLTIRNNRIFDCTWGVSCVGGNVSISNNRFVESRTVAILCSDATGVISDNVVNNSDIYTFGSGIHWTGNCSLVVSGNRVTYGSYGITGPGGGVVIERNTIAYTTRGISISQGAPLVRHNVVTDCQQWGSTGGSGISITGGSPTIVGNIIARNTFRGIDCINTTNAIITNNTICHNAYNAVWLESSSYVVTNNIIAFNQYGLYGYFSDGSQSNNLLFNTTSEARSPTDIVADPLFADQANGDYHIRSISPCVDAGDNTAPALPDVDVDGQDRIHGASVDIGADEQHGEAYPGRIVYVKHDSLHNGPGDDWDHAWRSIIEALPHAYPGDEIRVARGDYAGGFIIKPGVSLKGAYSGIGADRDYRTHRTTIMGPTSGNYMVRMGAWSHIDGFDIIGGRYGISAGSVSTKITNNAISGMRYAGIELMGGSAEINHNTLVGNQSGVSVWYSDAVIAYNTITGNSRSGVYTVESSPLITNNLISGNATDGIGLGNGSPVVTNNTIAGNGRGITSYADSAYCANNIVAYNSAIGVWRNNGSIDLRNNCVFGHELADYMGCVKGITDIAVDPQFVSLAFGDFHIGATSPCRNAGDSFATGVMHVDIDGQPRVYGGAIDIGADESHGEVYPSPYSPRILRVNASALAGGDGSTWAAAYNSIQAALDDCMLTGGAEIWVAEGAYNERISMRPFAHVYGGFNGTETWRIERDWAKKRTIIDADDPSTEAGVITGANMCTVDGFTVRGGYWGFYCYFSSIMIRNNIITDNADYGVYVSDKWPRIINNQIVANGGGVYITLCGYHGPWLINNTIASNSGYGVYNLSGIPEVANNVIAFNQTGIYHPADTTFLARLAYNNVYGNATANYVNTPVGATDISADPVFLNQAAGDYHIHANSPCRNAGDISAPMLPATDIDGQPRIQADFVDIGADESYGEGASHNIIHVKHDSPVNGPGSDWSNAWRTIGEAMAAASLDDEVWVAAGYYQEKVAVKAGVALKGGYSGIGAQRNIRANATTVDAANTAAGNYTVTAADSALVDGFTIKGGNNGIYALPGRPILTRNLLTSNYMGISCGAGSYAVIDANVFASNTHGFYCVGSSPLVTNNVFTKNSTGINCNTSSAPAIVGNTVADNTARGIRSVGASPLLINNIVAFNPTGIYLGGQGSVVLSHNNVFGNATSDYYPANTPHPLDISEDPLFINRVAGDYHISAASPCIDTGIDSELLPAVDFDGQGRMYGAAVDIGADERWPAAISPPDLRNVPDGTPIRCGGGVVSAVWPDFFYIQAANRAGGIRVNQPGHGLMIRETVEVTGVLRLLPGGERCIDDAAATQTSPGFAQVHPVGMNHLTVGGNYVWSWRKVVDIPEPQWMQGDGPANVGMLIRTWGRITQIDSSGAFFYIDDGSATKDGTRTEVSSGVFEDSIGVRVNHSPTGLNVGDYLILNGISSCFTDGGDPKRLVLPRAGELWVVD